MRLFEFELPEVDHKNWHKIRWSIDRILTDMSMKLYHSKLEKTVITFDKVPYIFWCIPQPSQLSQDLKFGFGNLSFLHIDTRAAFIKADLNYIIIHTIDRIPGYVNDNLAKVFTAAKNEIVHEIIHYHDQKEYKWKFDLSKPEDVLNSRDEIHAYLQQYLHKCDSKRLEELPFPKQVERQLSYIHPRAQKLTKENAKWLTQEYTNYYNFRQNRSIHENINPVDDNFIKMVLNRDSVIGNKMLQARAANNVNLLNSLRDEFNRKYPQQQPQTVMSRMVNFSSPDQSSMGTIR